MQYVERSVQDEARLTAGPDPAAPADPHAPLRPGGPELTRRALALAAAPPGARLLDLGCGRGESAALAAKEPGLLTVGLDLCAARLRDGQTLRPGQPLLQGTAERLPVADGSLDVILAECSLSLIDDRAAALGEIRRALRPGGALALTDVYLRSPERAPGLDQLLAAAGRGLARSRAAICAELAACGLAVALWEDHSSALRDFACAGGAASAGSCWEPAPGVDPFALALAVARARPGYFLLVARRGPP